MVEVNKDLKQATGQERERGTRVVSYEKKIQEFKENKLKNKEDPKLNEDLKE